MCFLKIPTNQERELLLPWLIRVKRLISSRCYWQAAKVTRNRVEMWPLWICLTTGFNPEGESTQEVLAELVEAGLFSAADRETLIRCEAFLDRVIDRHVDASMHASELLSVVREVVEVTGDDNLTGWPL